MDDNVRDNISYINYRAAKLKRGVDKENRRFISFFNSLRRRGLLYSQQLRSHCFTLMWKI